MDPHDRLEALRRELTQKREYLAQLREQLPRHSVRPHQMIEIEDTEDAIDELAAEVGRLEASGD